MDERRKMMKNKDHQTGKKERGGCCVEKGKQNDCTGDDWRKERTREVVTFTRVNEEMEGSRHRVVVKRDLSSVHM